MDIESSVKRVEEWSIHITGITWDDLKSIRDGLCYLNEALPDGLNEAMLKLYEEVKKQLLNGELF